MRAPDHVIHLFEEVSDRISSRDLSGSVELFDLTSDVVIVGSEEGYGAKGADDIPGFFRKLYGRNVSFAWHWTEIIGAELDDTAWGFADGHEIVTQHGSSKRLPYRMSMVSRRIGPAWKIVLLHGSEPVTE